MFYVENGRWLLSGGMYRAVPGVVFQKFFLILYLYCIHHILSCEKVKKVKISKVTPTPSFRLWVFTFRVVGSNGATCDSIKSKMAADGHLGYTKNGHNFATVLPIDVMFASRVRFSGSADLMVPLSMTLSEPKPQFKGHSIV